MHSLLFQLSVVTDVCMSIQCMAQYIFLQNLTVEKDLERGEELVDTSIKSSGKRNQCCVHSTCVLGILLVFTVSVSLSALCVSLLSYREATSGRGQLLPSATRGPTMQLVDDEDVEREALKEVIKFCSVFGCVKIFFEGSWNS